MNRHRIESLIRALIQPMAGPRLITKLVRVGQLTTKHLRAIPQDADDATLAVCSNVWAAELIKVLGVKIHIVKVQELPQGAKLLISNHRSYADILVLLSLFPCRFLAKEEVKQWPLIGTAAKAVRTLFVRRDAETSRRMSREAIEEGLKSGGTITIFPEGTTSSAPGCRPFFQGSFEVATKVGAPVVPIAIEYAHHDIWLGHTAFENFLRTFSRKNIDVFVGIGAPIYPKVGKDATPDDVLDEAQRLKERTHDWIHRYLIEAWPEANELLHK